MFILFLSLFNLSTSLLAPSSKIIKKKLKHHQLFTPCFPITTQSKSLPQQSISTLLQILPATYAAKSAHRMQRSQLLLTRMSKLHCQNQKYSQQKQTNLEYFLTKKFKFKQQPKAHSNLPTHHRRGARFNRGGGHQRATWYNTRSANYGIHTRTIYDPDIMLTTIRNISHATQTEFEHNRIYAPTAFTRFYFKIIKFLLPSTNYVNLLIEIIALNLPTQLQHHSQDHESFVQTAIQNKV